MFTIRAEILRPLVAWLVDACGGGGTNGTESVSVRMNAATVTLQNITAGNTIVINIVVPRDACAAWEAPADTDPVEHRLALRPLKVLTDSAADDICMRLPSARNPDRFQLEMRTRGGGILSSASLIALEATDAYFPVDEIEFETALTATFQSRELCASVSHARALGLEVTELRATSDAALELRSTSTGSSSVDEYVVAFAAVDDPVLFRGGELDAPPADEDGDAPRVKRRAATTRVARIPNSILDMRCDRRIYKPLSFKIKFFERLLLRATFCTTVTLATVVGENGSPFRLVLTPDAEPRVAICAFVAPAISNDEM